MMTEDVYPQESDGNLEAWDVSRLNIAIAANTERLTLAEKSLAELSALIESYRSNPRYSFALVAFKTSKHGAEMHVMNVRGEAARYARAMDIVQGKNPDGIGSPIMPGMPRMMP